MQPGCLCERLLGKLVSVLRTPSCLQVCGIIYSDSLCQSLDTKVKPSGSNRRGGKALNKKNKEEFEDLTVSWIYRSFFFS